MKSENPYPRKFNAGALIHLMCPAPNPSRQVKCAADILLNNPPGTRIGSVVWRIEEALVVLDCGVSHGQLQAIYDAHQRKAARSHRPEMRERAMKDLLEAVRWIREVQRCNSESARPRLMGAVLLYLEEALSALDSGIFAGTLLSIYSKHRDVNVL